METGERGGKGLEVVGVYWRGEREEELRGVGGGGTAPGT